MTLHDTQVACGHLLYLYGDVLLSIGTSYLAWHLPQRAFLRLLRLSRCVPALPKVPTTTLVVLSSSTWVRINSGDWRIRPASFHMRKQLLQQQLPRSEYGPITASTTSEPLQQVPTFRDAFQSRLTSGMGSTEGGPLRLPGSSSTHHQTY